MYPNIGDFSKLLYEKSNKKSENTRIKEYKRLLASTVAKNKSGFLSSDDFSDHLPTLTSIYF